MKVSIIGWYGTETIGDRAILAGLISLMSRSYTNLEINLGSLNPFFSERTVREDLNLIHEMCGKVVPITLFNTQDSAELKKNVRDSDLIVMGGGPLMDLQELFMVEYTFNIAKKLKKKTALLGCGIGPLFQKKFRKCVINIVKNSDLVILRDSKSKDNLNDIFKEFKISINLDKIYTSLDPAVEVGLFVSNKRTPVINDTICINLRDFPLEYSHSSSEKNVNDALFDFTIELAKSFPEKKILLVPMHYFHVGNDDRDFLNKILFNNDFKNIEVQNKPLTLRETFEIYQDAYFNIGMRFHSIVFQTIVSGRNFILDYTEPNKGKIFGFIKDVDSLGFYKNRYIALQEDLPKIDMIKNVEEKFKPDYSQINTKLKLYINHLKEL